MAIEGNAPELPAAAPPDDDASGPAALPATGAADSPGHAALSATGALSAAGPRRRSRRERYRQLALAVRDSDYTVVEQAVLRLSRSRRWLAPLALAVGAFAMLFEGVKLLFTNWRLTLIQVLPAMWIWAAMVDLKAHLLHGKSLHELTGPIVIPLVLAVAVVTAASFFLNAVFAFAITGPGRPEIRPAFTQARSHLVVVLAWGMAVGICLGLSTVVFTRWGLLWFSLSLSIVIGVMMVCYVAVPARLIGVKNTHSQRDKLTATAVGGAIGAVVCTPPYVLGRIGLVMLDSHTLFILGCVVIGIGLTLQAGATGAVKTVKMSAKLRQQTADEAAGEAPSPAVG